MDSLDDEPDHDVYAAAERRDDRRKWVARQPFPQNHCSRQRKE